MPFYIPPQQQIMMPGNARVNYQAPQGGGPPMAPVLNPMAGQAQQQQQNPLGQAMQANAMQQLMQRGRGGVPGGQGGQPGQQPATPGYQPPQPSSQVPSSPGSTPQVNQNMWNNLWPSWVTQMFQGK